jgi:hypothetical protein
MKFLIYLPDSKASSLIEVLKSISYVKVKPLTKAKAEPLPIVCTSVGEK